MKNKKMIKYACIAAVGLSTLGARGQSVPMTPLTPAKTISMQSRAWELGLGGSLLQHSNVSFGDIHSNADNSFTTRLKINQMLIGGQLYLAHELKSWLYWDLQAAYGVDRFDSDAHRFYYAGPGLQFRFLSINRSRSVEPYVRVGVNYFHNEAPAYYNGSLKASSGESLPFNVKDEFNHNRENKKTFYPFSLGLGINSWFNDSWGVGLQADYIAAFYDNTPHFPAVSMRLMCRLGGRSHTQRVEPVPVVAPVATPSREVVEKVVTVRDTVTVTKTEILSGVYFNFDSSDLTSRSQQDLDRLAEVIKQHQGYRLLITGYTDGKGANAYNVRLSRQRAKAVYDYLIARGVHEEMLKWRGVGRRATAVSPSEADVVREGDRKVLLEVVENIDYWNAITSH